MDEDDFRRSTLKVLLDIRLVLQAAPISSGR